MRKKWDEQLSIWHYLPKNRVSRELRGISEILDAHPEILEGVYTDLSKAHRVDTGRDGMTAEQVVRCAVLKQYRTLTYEELEFHLQDSHSFRAFSKLRMGQTPSASTLQENIKALSVETWMAVHEATLRHAESQGWEKGRKARIDSTVVETNIHLPTDSTLLQDGMAHYHAMVGRRPGVVSEARLYLCGPQSTSEEAVSGDFARQERGCEREGV